MRYFSDTEIIMEISEFNLDALKDLKTFVHLSSFLLSTMEFENNAYFFFKDAIDKIASQKRVPFNIKALLSHSVSVRTEAVVDYIGHITRVLKNDLSEYGDNFKLFMTYATVGMLNYIVKNPDRFVNEVKKTFSAIKRAFELGPRSMDNRSRKTLIHDIMDLVMAFVYPIYDLFYVTSEIGSEFVPLYGEVLLTFMLAVVTMTANVLGNWCGIVLKHNSIDIIGTETIIMLISIGCIMIHVFDECIRRNEPSTLERVIDKVLVNTLANIIATWHDIDSECRDDADCVASVFADAYSDNERSAYFEMAMSLYAR